jgi:phosphate starvation-inducible PhoH-like protein|tara:strand:- start:3866 stop:4603 length:738 start_codon:yes stop_codon:yes gene_type:complete
MAIKRATRKKKESDITEEFEQSYKQKFDCSNIKLRKQFPLTHNQTSFYYKSQEEKTSMLLLDGVAGTAKTYIAVYTALELLKASKVDQIVYIRSVVESSSKSIGALPGELEDKFSPYSMPLIDKMNEILDKQTINSLMEGQYIKAIPVNFVRGLTFNNSFVIIDEAQNLTRSELTTILTRFGRNSKYIVCGDCKQSDIKDSGFTTVFNLFDTDFSKKNDIHNFTFGVEDIVRSPILKHITQILGV